jgi:acetamidase/formamidase
MSTEALIQLSSQAETVLATKPANPPHRLPATPDTCRWGYLDPAAPPVLTIASGDRVAVEAITHHAGDAPDLLMDDAIRQIWQAIPAAERGPGVHLLTGPVHVIGARPGGAVMVSIESMTPRGRYGSNLAAHWGLLHDSFGKERVTVYELEATTGFGQLARPVFGYDFTGRPLYDEPGYVSDAASVRRQPFGRPVSIPVRPHFGLLSVAPPGSDRISSVPPGVFGGNVDNWRFGPGARIFYPVFTEGAGISFGDPHFGQGDGEVCGTAIEASANAVVRLAAIDDLPITAPVLETDSQWYAHGFGDDLDAAARMAVEQLLSLLVWRTGLSRDEAYSVMSVAMDLSVTQVVDSVLGCHAGIPRAVFS